MTKSTSIITIFSILLLFLHLSRTLSSGTTMTKDCGNHGSCKCKRHKLYRLIFAFFVGLIVLVLFVILVVWLALRPSRPKFYLQDASISSFNLSAGPTLLTSVIQVTISSRNPNDRVGILYDKLDVYAVYKNQQITLPTLIQPLYQGHNDVEVWSPYLCGTAIPIAPYLAAAISQDEAAGLLVLHVRLDGKVRWKVGSWTSGHYRIDISCPALLTIDGGRGERFNPSIRFQQLSTCSVDV